MSRKCEQENCENEGTYYNHYCPYQGEIYDNEDENFCNCCSDCEDDCRMSV
jgi:hypothetical protein